MRSYNRAIYRNIIISGSDPHTYCITKNSLLIMAARQLCCGLDLQSSFFRRLISEVAWPIVTKLCYMLDGDPDL